MHHGRDNRPEILIVGDPGPAGGLLLARSDLSVLWAANVGEADIILAVNRPNLVLMAYHREDAPSLPESRVFAQAVPCILLFEPGVSIEPVLAQHCMSLSLDKVELILGQVSLHTGLPFARDARADLCVRVQVRLGDMSFELESVNLSASGVAVRNFPDLEMGTVVRLNIHLPSTILETLARLVRFSPAGEMAGLEFIKLSASDRAQIRKVVQPYFAPSLQGCAQYLFGDLTCDMSTASDALATRDLSLDSPSGADEKIASEEYEMIRKILLGATRMSREAPLWMSRVAHEMTQLESEAIRDRANAPEWVREALDIRIRLARQRIEGGKIPQRLTLDAYRMFVSLGEVGLKESIAAAEIANMRAGILREVLAAAARSRTGATIYENATGCLESGPIQVR